MRIAIGIPTLGRAAILGQALDELARQSRQPDRIVVCCARPEDVPERAKLIEGFECLLSEPGSSCQRNRIIEHVADCDVLLFLDDDFVMRDDYLAVTEALFAARPSVVVATGTVVRDGIHGKGLTFAEARTILDGEAACRDPLGVTPVANGYGCNMALRLSVVRDTGVRFDESLPLYAWQEDAELSCRLAAHGEVVRVEGTRGVHLGVKMGRSAGVQLGYSQVINPLYIARRVPAYTMRRAISHLACNLAANLARFATPEPWVDRRGRLRGNILGLMDALRGRLTPERVLLLGAAERRHAGAVPHGYDQGYRALGNGFEPGPAANQNIGRQ